jgi:formylglycine-generating enzyme required for sulfatase activity
VVFEEPPTLSTLRPGFGPAVDAVFQKALAKSPADRYPDCSAFASALESSVDAATNARTVAFPAVPPASRIRWWPIVLAAVLACAGAATTYVVRRSHAARPAIATKSVSIVKAPQPIEQPPPAKPDPPPPTSPPAKTPKVAPPVAAVKAGTVRVNKKDGQKYVWIPPGTFPMGCVPDDKDCGRFAKPAHPVTITAGFWMAQTETTAGAYKAFSEVTNRDLPKAPNFNKNWSLTDHPIVNVNWDDAVAYCSRAGGRLPTEAEWEYAARGGAKETIFAWGNQPSHDQANFGQGAGGADEQGATEGKDQWIYTSPVASFPPNGFQLYDMTGNAAEWCADWFSPTYYANSPEKDPRGPATGTIRVVRGGNWKSPARFLHLSYRGTRAPQDWGYTSGFRCVVNALP